MESFKQFAEQTKEQEKNIKDTFAKLPKKHQALIKDFKIKWYPDHTLPGDSEHIGLLNPTNKTITIAASFFYPREWTLLHEIGHLVFEKFMTKKLFEEWKHIVKNTKHKMKQNDEELWCMNYADFFAKNKILVHHHPEWLKFMEKFVKMTS